MATSRQDEGTRVDALHPVLAHRLDLTCEPFDPDKLAAKASVAFLGLPHTASFAVTPALRERGVKVIDLSADYRLKDAGVYADWYGHAHTDAAGLREAVYGLPELFRSQIKPAGFARRVARSAPCRAGAGALFGHGGGKARHIHGAAGFAQSIFGEIEREAERIIQFKGDCAGELFAGA